MASLCVACYRPSAAELCRRCEEAQLRDEAKQDARDAARERTATRRTQKHRGAA